MVAATMLLTGCGSKAEEGSSASTETATTGTATTVQEAAEPEEKEPVELTLWNTSRTSDFENMMNDEFMKANPHIKLNIVVHEGDPGNDYFTAVAAGNAPDVVKVSLPLMDKYINAGILLDLSTYVNAWDDKANISKQLLDSATRDGKVYGISNCFSVPMLFGYNKALFAEAGLTDAPKTWEEVLDYAKKLTKPEKQQYGYGMLSAQWTEWWFQFHVWQAGGDLTKKNADGTMELTFTDPAVIQAAKYYQDLRKAKVTQSDVTMNFDDMFKNFAAGKCGMMIMGADSVGWLQSMGMKVTEDLGLAPMPAGPSGKGTTSISGANYVINPNASKEKQDAAWEYIKYIVSKDFITASFQDMADNGNVTPFMCGRTDVNVADFLDINPDWAKASADAATVARDEFYGKGSVGSYIDKAVQKIIIVTDADPEEEFKAAQDLAAKEVLENFNSENKAQ
jgi:ABC-type glycerol-3-phosphate transport system substrate-binding protein